MSPVIADSFRKSAVIIRLLQNYKSHSSSVLHTRDKERSVGLASDRSCQLPILYLYYIVMSSVLTSMFKKSLKPGQSTLNFVTAYVLASRKMTDNMLSYTVNHKKGGRTFVIITLENLDGFL